MSWRINTRTMVRAIIAEQAALNGEIVTIKQELRKIRCKHEHLSINCLSENKGLLFCTDCNASIQYGTYNECMALLKDQNIKLAKKKMDDATKAYDNLVSEAENHNEIL